MAITIREKYMGDSLEPEEGRRRLGVPYIPSTLTLNDLYDYFVAEASLGSTFYWENGVLDVSGGGGDCTTCVKEASLGYDFMWNNDILDISTMNIDELDIFVLEASLGTSFKWGSGVLDASGYTGSVIAGQTMTFNNGILVSVT